MVDIDFENPDIRDSFTRVAKVQAAFELEVSESSDQIDGEKESYDAYFSDSWKTEIKEEREARGLPVSDVARFASIVDTISGSERQSRTDITVFPFEGDDQFTADVANLYLKYRNRKNSLWHEDSLAYMNSIISKRAHFEYFLRNNPNDGSLETVRRERPASEVFVQRPFRMFTAEDSRGTIHAQWVAIEELKKQFGKKIPHLFLLDSTPKERKPVHEITHLLDAYDFPDLKNRDLFFKKEKHKDMVRVIRWWRRHKKIIYRILNPSPNSFDEILIGTEKSKQKALQRAIAFLNENPEIAVNLIVNNQIEVEGEIVKEATNRNIQFIADTLLEENLKDVYAFHYISGRVELEYQEDWGDFLPWTHLFCYFVDGKAGGLHERIKDLIQEVNFIHAKLMQRLGTMGKMPIAIEDDATDMDDDSIRKNFEDGGIIKLKPESIRRGKIKEFEDKTLSSIPAYITLEETLNATMKELTGANDPLQGRSPGANTAGVAIDLLQRKGSALIAPIEDNYKRFKMENAKMEIKMLLRQYELKPNWTAMKLARIVGGMIPRSGMANSPLDQIINRVDQMTTEEDETGKVVLMNNILKMMRKMEYDFTVDETIHSPSLRVSILQSLVQMATALGIPVPPTLLVENTELPQKQKDAFLEFANSTAGQEQVAARQPAGGLNSNGSLSNI